MAFFMFFVCMSLSLVFCGFAMLAGLNGEKGGAAVLLGFSFLMGWYVFLLGPYL